MKENEVLNYCVDCKKETRHSVLADKKVTPPNDIDEIYDQHYKIVICNGCDQVSFRFEHNDYDAGGYDENGEYDYPKKIETYPETLRGHEPLPYVWRTPKKVRAVYNEVLVAIQSKCYILAGAGCRAIIEGICLEEKLEGRDLKKKIDKLCDKGLISKQECQRLHTIRFLGNDSVHDLEKPTEPKLFLVLTILEHLLTNLYILDYIIQDTLDTLINTYNDFLEFLWKKSMQLKIDDEKPLIDIIGKDIRRIEKDLFQTYEKQFEEMMESEERLEFAILELKKEVNGETGKVQIKYKRMPQRR